MIWMWYIGSFAISITAAFTAYSTYHFWISIMIFQIISSAAILGLMPKKKIGIIGGFLGMIVGCVVGMGLDNQGHNLWPIELSIIALFLCPISFIALISAISLDRKAKLRARALH